MPSLPELENFRRNERFAEAKWECRSDIAQVHEYHLASPPAGVLRTAALAMCPLCLGGEFLRASQAGAISPGPAGNRQLGIAEQSKTLARSGIGGVAREGAASCLLCQVSVAGLGNAD